MATAIANADDVWTGAATWGTVDATSLLASMVSTVQLTTAKINSAAFSPGAITVDGIAVFVHSVAAGSVATLTVRLEQGGVTVTGTDVTIDLGSLPGVGLNTDIDQIGWVFLRFASPVLLLAATPYTVAALTSANSQAILRRDGTANNVSRMLRTTAAVTLGAGDNMHVLGERTGGSTVVARTVTVDQTVATDYGAGTAHTTSNIPGCTVGDGGVLQYGNTASTDYVLRFSTWLVVALGGRLTIGTVAAPIPRSGSATLEFDSIGTSTGQTFGLAVFGELETCGESPTAGVAVDMALLAADAAAAATALTVDRTTGWLPGDEIVVVPTVTASEAADDRIVDTVVGPTVNVTVGLTNAHTGTAPVQAEVLHLTRNVVIQGTSFGCSVQCLNLCAVVLTWTRLRNLSIVGGVAGLPSAVRGSAMTSFSPQGGSVTTSFMAVTQGLNGAGGAVVNGATTFWTRTVSHSHLVVFDIQSTADGITVVSASPGADTYTVTDVTLEDVAVCMNNASNHSAMELQASQGRVTMNRVHLAGRTQNGSSTGGLLISSDNSGSGIARAVVDWSDIVIHSTRGDGLTLSSGSMAGLLFRLRNVDVWHQVGSGNGVDITPVSAGGPALLENCRFFGNDTFNVIMGAGPFPAGIVFRNCVSAGSTDQATTTGMQLPSFGRIRFEGCEFSPTSGVFVPHTNDLNTVNNLAMIDAAFIASTFEAANFLASGALAFPMAGTTFRYQSHQGVAGDDSTVVYGFGSIVRDASVFRTAAPSERLTPNGAPAAARLRSGPWMRRVQSGVAITPSVYVRVDGSYAGSSPRLVALANAAVGILDDTVIATWSGAVDSWVLVSGTTIAPTADGAIAFVVEVDGAAGNVYLDDWA